MTNWDLIPIVPYLLMTPFHGILGCVYAYSVKLAVDDETYRTFCKKQGESYDVLITSRGYDLNEYKDDYSKPE